MSDILKRLREKALPALEERLQEGVNKAATRGELARDIAAGGAALTYAAADYVLPESAIDVIPQAKMTKKLKKLIDGPNADLIRKTAKERGMDPEKALESISKASEGKDLRKLAANMKASEATPALSKAAELRKQTQASAQKEAFAGTAESISEESLQDRLKRQRKLANP